MKWRKLAESLGSALPDSTKSDAAAAPSAPVAVENKTAPGQTGPRGMAPRTTYSRVNTGGSPTPSFGGEQKATAPRGMEFLPQKVAHEEKTSMASMMTRPLLQDLVKQAMDATVSKVSITTEASRQMGLPQEKTAARRPPSTHIPSEVCEKYASALEYLAKQAESEGVGPGQGPNTMGILEATSEGTVLEAGQSGQATAKNQPPMNPPTQAFPDSNGAGNAMETNLDMEHGEQPVDPMNNETASNEGLKAASMKLANKNLKVLKKLAAGLPTDLSPEERERMNMAMLSGGVGGAIPLIGAGAIGGGVTEGWRGAGHTFLGSGAGGMAAGSIGRALGGGAGMGAGIMLGGGVGGALGNRLAALKNIRDERAAALSEGMAEEPKQASAKKTASLRAKNLAVLGLKKQAEDAINPAQISAGAASAEGAEAPLGVSAAEEGPLPAEPSDVNSQKRLIDNIDAAIAYTKRQAKEDPKRDLGQLLTEPALSSASDRVLDEAFAHTTEAGPKIASAQVSKVSNTTRLTKTAAAHALLLKLAEEAQAGRKPKEKNSQLSDPQSQSNFSAAGMAPQGAKARPQM